MSHELLHVFEHTESHGFLHGRKVIEELREWPAMFKVMDAGDLSRHGFTSPNGMLRVYVCRAPVVILVWQRWRSPAAAFTLLDTAAVGCSACWAACHRRPIQ